ALKKAGVADKDIQTSNLSLNPVYQPQRNLPDGTVEPAQPRIVGYQANNTVSVRQRNRGAVTVSCSHASCTGSAIRTSREARLVRPADQ
ncbi:SIMPL domain-containing protein, partial [Mycobacterium tuberculosis]